MYEKSLDGRRTTPPPPPPLLPLSDFPAVFRHRFASLFFSFFLFSFVLYNICIDDYVVVVSSGNGGDYYVVDDEIRKWRYCCGSLKHISRDVFRFLLTRACVCAHHVFFFILINRIRLWLRIPP